MRCIPFSPIILVLLLASCTWGQKQQASVRPQTAATSVCSLFVTNSTCLENPGCDWCSPGNNSIYYHKAGVCYDMATSTCCGHSFSTNSDCGGSKTPDGNSTCVCPDSEPGGTSTCCASDGGASGIYCCAQGKTCCGSFSPGSTCCDVDDLCCAYGITDEYFCCPQSMTCCGSLCCQSDEQCCPGYGPDDKYCCPLSSECSSPPGKCSPKVNPEHNAQT